ncbi:hypothetical protein Tco_0771888 [Tanacetum coccineum]|uniref:Uncharacterized protein n=1 Tax=Tanacetum coccineum TaxID=301880 RepID=A0ABQ4ZHF5_9ASTR
MLDYRIQQLFNSSSEGSDISNDEENKAEENKANAEVVEKQARNIQTSLTMSSSKLKTQSMHQHPHHQPHKLKFKCVRPLARKTVQEKLGMLCWLKEHKDGQTTVAENNNLHTPLPLLLTPTPTLTPMPTKTSIPALPDFSSVFQINQRVSNLKKGLSELKQADQSAQLLITIKSQIPAMVAAHLGIRIGDYIQKALRSYIAEFEKEA